MLNLKERKCIDNSIQGGEKEKYMPRTTKYDVQRDGFEENVKTESSGVYNEHQTVSVVGCGAPKKREKE